MAKYILVDGVLTLSTPETKRWAHRSSKGVPQDVPEDTKEPEVPRDSRSEFEVLQDLDETPEL